MLALLRDMDAVFASLLSVHSIRALELLRALRPRFEGPILLGGIHPTVCPEPCAQAADWICRGEGDEAVLHMAEALEEGGSLDALDNAGYWRKGRLHLNPLRPPIPKLDPLPFPDYRLQDDWVLEQGRFVPMTSKRFEKDHVEWGFGLPTYCILSARGCPLRCTYCYNSLHVKTYGGRLPMRFMSPERAIREVESALSRHTFLRRVFFCDDDFFARPEEEFRAMCGLYRERVGLPFRCEASARTLTEEKLQWALDANLKGVEVGIQSGSDRIRNQVYGRPETEAMLLKAGHLLHEASRSHGLVVDYDVLVDNPYETTEERVETVRFMAGFPRPFRLNVFSVLPFPGTEYRERLIEDRLLDADPALYNRNYVDLFRSDLTWTTLLLLLQSQAPWLTPSWILKPALKANKSRWSDRFAKAVGWLVGEWLLPLGFALWMLKSRLLDGWNKAGTLWKRGRQGTRRERTTA